MKVEEEEINDRVAVLFASPCVWRVHNVLVV